MKEAGGVGLFQKPAFGKEQDLGSKAAGLGDVMGGYQDLGAAFGNMSEALFKFGGGGGIKIGRWLIKQDNIRPGDDGAGKVKAFSFAAGQGGGGFGRVGVEPCLSQSSGDPVCGPGAADATGQ